MAIKIGGTTVINDSRSLENITGGAILGIQSAGTVVGSGATVLNFIGAGNTFAYDPDTKTLDISIQGGGSSDLGDYYIFRKPAVGFATMKVLIAGSQGGIAYSDYIGGSVYTGLTTTNTDQFPWVAGIAMTIASNGHLTFTVP